MKPSPLALIGAALFAAGLSTVCLDPASIGPVAGRNDIRDFMLLQVYAGIPATIIGAVMLAWVFSPRR